MQERTSKWCTHCRPQNDCIHEMMLQIMLLARPQVRLHNKSREINFHALLFPCYKSTYCDCINSGLESCVCCQVTRTTCTVTMNYSVAYFSCNPKRGRQEGGGAKPHWETPPTKGSDPPSPRYVLPPLWVG